MIMFPGLKPSLRLYSAGLIGVTPTGAPSGWFFGIESLCRLSRRPVSVEESATVK